MAFFSLENQYIYNLISDYYENPILYKIKDEENNSVSIYGAQLTSFLLNERYYIICMSGYRPEPELKLNEIAWNSFQVRTLEDEKYSQLPKIKYRLKKESKYLTPIEIISRNENLSTYKVHNLPLKISLMHRKGLEYEYSNEGTIQSALETHQTILQFI